MKFKKNINVNSKRNRVDNSPILINKKKKRIYGSYSELCGEIWVPTGQIGIHSIQ